MISIPEYREAAQRRANRGALAFLTIAAGVFALGFTPLILFGPRSGSDPGDWLGQVGVMLGVGFGVAAAIAAAVVFWRRAALDQNSRCLHCGKSLATNVPLVVASRRCYHCGELVLDDPDEPPEPGEPAPELPTRWEFTQGDQQHQTLAVPVLIGGLLGSYIGCGGAGAAVSHFKPPPPFDVVMFAGMAAIVPIGTAAVLIAIFQRAKKNTALTCHWCGTVLAGQGATVAATRRCIKCGQSAIAPRFRPFPPPHAGPPFTVAAITDRENARYRVTWQIVAGCLTALVAVVLLILMPFLIFGGKFNLELWLTPRLGEKKAMMLVDFGPPLVILVALFLVVASGQWLNRRALKKYPLDCPRCGKQFLPAFARATRCCHHCRWPIVVDPPTAA